MRNLTNLDEVKKKFYKILNNPKNGSFSFLEQGSVLLKSQKVHLNRVFTGESALGLVILNYSCDIQKKSTTHIYLAPILPAKEYINPFIHKIIKKENDNRIKNKQPALVNPKIQDLSTNSRKGIIKVLRNFFQFKDREAFALCPIDFPNVDLNLPWSYIPLNQIKSYPKMQLFKKPILDKFLLTLQSPYKEKLGSILGSRINNIGTENLDQFTPEIMKEMSC